MTDLVDPFDPPQRSSSIKDPFDFDPPAPVNPVQPKPVAAAEEPGDFARGLKRTLPELKQLGGGTLAAIGDVTGIDAIRDKGLEIYKAGNEVVSGLTKPNDSASEAFKQVKQGNLGAGADFLQNAAGYTTGQAIESIIAAGAGALAGSEVPVVGNVAGAIGGVIAKGAVKKAVTKQAEKIVAEQVAKGAAKEAAEKAGQKFVADRMASEATKKTLQRVGGGALGAQAMNTTMELGSVYPEALEKAHAEGRELTKGEKARAVTASLGAAGLESVADMVNLGVLFRGTKAAAGAAAKDGIGAAVKRYAGRAAVAGAAGAARESGTEAAQTVLERFGAGNPLNDADAWRDYVDSAAVGAVGGALFGGVAAFHPRTDDGAVAGPSSRAVPAPGEDPADALRADVLQARSPKERAEAAQALFDHLQAEGRLLPPPAPVIVDPQGNAVTDAQATNAANQQVQADAALAHERADLGLTPDVNAARAAHPAAAPNLPFPEAQPGTLASAANTLATAAAQDAMAPAPEGVDPATGEVLPAQEQPAWSRDQVKSYLAAQVANGRPGTLPTSGLIAKTFGMPPEEASALRKEVIAEATRPAVSPAVGAQESADGRMDLAAAPAAEPVLPASTGPETRIPATPASQDESSVPSAQATPAAEPVQGAPAPRPAATGEGSPTPAAPAPAEAATPSPATSAPAVPGASVAAIEPASANAGPSEGAGAVKLASRTRTSPDRIRLPSPLEKSEEFPHGRGERHGAMYLMLARPNGAERGVRDTGWEKDPLRPAMESELRAGKFGGVKNGGPHHDGEMRAFAARYDELLREQYAREVDEANTVNEAAHEAATSEMNTLPVPSDAQKEAGNYKKGHVRIDGLDISIENPAGSRRRPEWPPLAHHYGYIKGTVGKDKDHVDVFMGERATDASLPVFVVDQYNADGTFDEHKVMLGFSTESEAGAAYRANYEQGWEGEGGVTPMTQAEFRAWARDPKATLLPAAQQVDRVEVAAARMGNQVFPVAGVADARQKLDAMRESADVGASQFPNVELLDPQGNPVGHLSYNGRAWLGPANRLSHPEIADDGTIIPIPEVRRRMKERFAADRAPDKKAAPAKGSDEIVAIKTVYGDTVRVRKADLDGDRELLPMYRKDGTRITNRKRGNSIARGNLDPDGSKQAARNAEHKPSVISRPSARSERDEGFTSIRSAMAAVKKAGLDTDEYEVRQVPSGYVAVLKAAFEPAPEPAQEPRAGQAHANATAPEHREVEPGITVDELKEMAADWRGYIDGGGDAEVTHIFDAPKKDEVVRLADKVKVFNKDHGWMTVAEAKAKIDEWENRALEQGRDDKMRSINGQKIVLSLFDLSGKWSLPWEQAGYQVFRFDIQDESTYEDMEGVERKIGDVHNMSVEFFNDLFGSFDGNDIHAILAACPCTDFAVSGARHFAAKDADGRTVSSVQLVNQTLAAIEYFKPAVWAIENPVGRIESLTGLPPWRLSFDPNHFGEDYTKKTLIWGRFNADLPIAPTEATEGSKMHRLYGGKSMATKNARSETPEGFAYAFFMANNAIDHPLMTLANKYDRLDRDAIAAALDAGVAPEEIPGLVDDAYYQDLDDEAANKALRDAAAGTNEDLNDSRAYRAATKARQEAPAPATDQSATATRLLERMRAAAVGDTMEAGGRTWQKHSQDMWHAIGGDFRKIEDRRTDLGMAHLAEAASAPKPDKARLIPTRREDGGVEMRVEPVADERPAPSPEKAQNPPQEASDVRRPGNREGDRAGSGRGDQRQQPAQERNDDPAAGVDAQQPGEAARPGAGGRAAASPEAGLPDGAGAGERGAAEQLAPDADGVPAERGPAPDPVVPKTDLTITGELDFSGVGAVGKFKQNLAAIALLKQLEADGRRATPAEQSVLARYVGWGGLPEAFRHPKTGKIKKGWEGRVAELEAALTPEELAAAGRSTQDAHYTAAGVVRAMWDAVARLGFARGRVLEPSMGTGNFFGLMPAEARAASNLTGVELDSITGRIAQQLYQTANVQVRGFNEIRIAPASFDLAIGNPPFGAQSIHDPQYPEESKQSIHNYFFAKSIASLRPGGVLAMVVSSSFMDANTSATRAWIAERARLLGAIRLPQTAFQQNANTAVTTDIVFLQRLQDGEQGNPEAWVKVGSSSDKGNAFALNRYFLDHPDMMLGRMVWSSHTTIGTAGAVLEATPGVDLNEALAEAVGKLPQDVYQAPGKTFAQAAANANPKPNGPEIPSSAKVYGFFVAPDGTIRQRQPDHNGEIQSVAVELPEGSAARVAGMARIRDLARGLLRAELAEATTDKALERQRAELNDAYDAFVKAHGRLSRDVNKRLFRDDPDGPLLLSLERDYDKGVSPAVAKKNGVASRKESANKADIFSKRTNFPVKPVTQVSDAKSAMLASLNEHGRLDPEFMLGIYPGKTIEDIEAELGDEVFRTPAGELVPADAYLSGNVKAKLAEAKASTDPRMRRNVAALEAVQPADIDPADIFVQVGTPWIAPSDYAAFVKETFEGTFKGRHLKALGSWSVDIRGDNRLLNNERWGTDRMGAAAIMEALMGNKPIAVYDKVEDDKRVLNVADTAAAKGKAAELQQAFLDWIWKDADRRERLARHFNDTYNTDVRRTFNGAHMTFPGMNRGILTGGALRPHQAAFAYRMVQDGVALADHVVGAGKTYASIAGTMEMRRLGLWRKPMIVVPNHLVDQWATDFVRLYPGANILAASRKDFAKQNRKRLFARIATGEWDAVIVAHSSFGFIPLPRDAEESILRGEVAEIEQALDGIRQQQGKKDLSFKQLQKRGEALQERIKRLAERPRDELMDFAEMGVDALVVDEAHEFKNLYFVTTQRNVAGLGSPEGSKKAFDLFVKMRHLSERDGGKNRVFLTGTPVSNTLSEVFHMQRYLQYDELKARDIAMFDTWASTFGQIVSDWEMDAAGRFKEKARFRKFANLPELVTLWRQVADTVTLADLKRDAIAQGRRFPVPKIKGGKRQNITVPRSPLQAEYIGEPKPVIGADGNPVLDPETGIPRADYAEGSIIWRMDHMPKDPSEDNHLKATGDARKASLEYRLVDPSAPDFPGSKINKAVENIAAIWKENAARRGTQLVFCDLSVPASARGKATEAAQAKMPTWFVRDGDDVEHVAGVKATLSAMPDRKFFSFKTKREGYTIYEAGSGLRVSSGKSKQDAIDDANAELTKNAAAWREQFEADAIPGEVIDAYIQRWEDQRAAAEEAAAERGDEETSEEAPAQTISMDELLADESKHSVYDDMKAKLIAAGVPEKEIAFIHDYDTDLQKADLFAKVNRGEIRILFGSTAKMGAGMNVQKKLVAEHHMDAPWRPSDLIQREGRILRQGNEFYEADPDGFEVGLYAYGTEQTYDARQWEIIETKAQGIETFQAGDASVREIEDISSEAASAADMKGAASGNPLILESIKLRKEVRDLEAQERSHKRALHTMESLIRSVDNKTAYAYKELRDVSARQQRYAGQAFNLTIGGQSFTDPKEVKAGPVLSAFKAAIERRGTEIAGTFRGLDVVIEPFMSSVRVFLYDGKEAIGHTEFGREDNVTPAGFVTRLENIFKRINAAVPDAQAYVAKIEREADQAREEIKRGFPKADELVAKRERQQKVVAALRSGKTSVEGDDAKFSRAERAPVRGVAPDALGALVARWTANWTGDAPAVVALPTAEGLPESAKAARGWQTAEGYYDDATGTVYLVAANLRDTVRAKEVLAHEAIGHYGIEAITSPALWQEIAATVRRMRESGKHAALFAEIGRRYVGANDGIFVREAVAVMAEKGVRNSVIDRVITALRRFLRNVLHLDLRLSETELRQHIVAAARYVRGGSRPRRLDSGNAFSRPALDPAREIPVIALQGGKFGSVATSEARSKARARALEWLEAMRNRGTTLTNEDSGITIGFSRTGNRELVTWTARPERIELLAALPAITRRALFAGMNEDTVDGGKRRWATFYAPVRIGGALRVAKLVARDAGNGAFYYDLQQSDVLETRNPAEAGSRGGGTPAPKAGPSRTMTVAQIRAVANAVGREGWGFSRTAGPFYSALVEAVERAQGAPKKGDAAAWRGWLDGAQRRGEFRQSERDWLGLDDFLAANGTTTREQLAEFVRANQVQVQDVVLSAEGSGLPEGWRVERDGEGFVILDEEGEERGYGDTRADAIENARDDDNAAPADRMAKFFSYQIPGGANYRELLLTLPMETAGTGSRVEFANPDGAEDFLVDMSADGFEGLDYGRPSDNERVVEFDGPIPAGVMPLIERNRGAIVRGQDTAGKAFVSSHFTQPNILAHVRFNERTDEAGRRVLFLEEIQSDWHQAGRKRGYATPPKSKRSKEEVRLAMSAALAANDRDEFYRLKAELDELIMPHRAGVSGLVPDAPFKATDEWAMLAFKRMVRWAADNGFDRVAWTTGEQQAARYDLSKQVRNVEYFDDERLFVHGIKGEVLYNEVTPAAKLPEVIGKEAAERLLAQPAYRDSTIGRTGATKRALSGDGLKMGGEGMRAFYDKILPAAVNKWGKRFGAKVGEAQIPSGEFSLQGGDITGGTFTAHALDLSEPLRAAAMQGQPLFSRPDPATTINAVDAAAAGMPDGLAEKAREAFRSIDPKNLRENLRPAWLGALTLRHLAELGGDIKLPQVGRYAARVQKMATDRNVMQEEATAVSDVWEKFQRADRAGADATANLMHDTTIAGVDPSRDYAPIFTGATKRGGNEPVTAESINRRLKLVDADLADTTGKTARERLEAEGDELRGLLRREQARAAAYPELVRRWLALPEQGRALYVAARDAYGKQSDRLEDAIVARINATSADERTRQAFIAQIRQQFESARLEGPYFPLARFGEFWISAEDKAGQPQFLMYERVQDWRDAQRDLAARGWVVKAAGRKIGEARGVAGASTGFMADLEKMLESAGIDESTRDEVWQLYLRTLPELSMRKHFIHRKKTAGYSGDALRAFAGNMFHGSFQIARVRHTHALEAELLALKEATAGLSETDPERAVKAAALTTEVGLRHEWVMNPKDSKAVSSVTSLGFAWYLGATPAAALVNLTQTAIVTFPVLASRFGATKAANALSAGMGRALRNVDGDLTRGLTDEERRAFQVWRDSGAIDRTQAHNLAGLSETDTRAFNPLARKVMNAVSFLFHRAEVVNREATALAAFRLARADGQSFAEATQYAEEVITESHFDYTNANRARWMQSNAAKVLLLFRQYSLNMTWFLWRNAYLGLKGETREVQVEARKKLAGVLGMTGLFAGALGMPLASVMFGLANAAAAAFGDDDDEPFDAEIAFRNFLADMLGPGVARVLTNGPVEALTGAEIGNRVSLNDLWLRDPDRELEGQAKADYLLEQAAGPVLGGMLVNSLRGWKMVEDGHTWRGVETMMPKAVKDGMRAMRFSTQGVNTLRGDPIIEDLGVGQALLQLAGFSPASLNERYDAVNAAKGFEQGLMERRQRLLNAYAMAWRADDTRTLDAVKDKILRWNEANPDLPISTQTIRQSLAARLRYTTRAESGVVLDRRIAERAREQARFAQ